MRRITLIATLALVALAVAAPATLARGDLWSGTWTVGGCCDKQHHRTTYGTIQLFLGGDGKTITGTYAFSGGGTLSAELNHEYGPTMSGTYKDGTGRGRFSATIQSDTVSFKGWSKPCRLFCYSVPWWGERQ